MEKIEIRYTREGILLNIPYEMLRNEPIKSFLDYLRLENFINQLNLSEKVLNEMVEESNEKIREQMKEEFIDAKDSC